MFAFNLPSFHFSPGTCLYLPGLGWNPGWWLRSGGRSHDGDRKLRPKPKPVASILKFRNPNPNPVASKIIIWKPKPKSVASRPKKWESKASGFGIRSRSRSQTRSGAKAHRSHDERLRKENFELEAKSITRPKHLKNHVLKWVEATKVALQSMGNE